MWFRKTNGTDEAIEAVNEAAQVVKQVNAKTPEVKRLSHSFRHRRTQNHFAEQIDHLFTRG